jgi:hypothetical protein
MGSRSLFNAEYRENTNSSINLLLLLQQQQSALPCLRHSPITIQDTIKPGSDPNKTLLQHGIAPMCGRLKRQWLHNPPISDYAKQIDKHQSNCSLPVATHHFDNTFGLGSHIVLWGQAMCNGMEENYRMQSYAYEWLWLDQQHCDMNHQAKISPLLCYFPSCEHRCPKNYNPSVKMKNITDPRKTTDWCKIVKSSQEIKSKVRASSTEYLFQRLSPIVVQEAQRQIGIIFPDGYVPDDLVTVHIRWGKLNLIQKLYLLF